MLGSIEELEKDIEKFRSNVLASNELCDLLTQVVAQIKQQNGDFEKASDDVLSKLDGIPSSIENANNASNGDIKRTVSAEVDRALHSFSEEQDKYLTLVDQTQQSIQAYIDQSQNQTQKFKASASELCEKIEQVVEQIRNDTKDSLNEHRDSIDSDIEKRNQQFSETQQQFVAEMKETKEKLRNCEEQLLSKYQEFLGTLESTNLANIYEQNLKLQSELNRRTSIIIGISVISAILGIVGLFL